MVECHEGFGFDDFDPFTMFEDFFSGFGRRRGKTRAAGGGFGGFGFDFGIGFDDDDDDDFFGGGFGSISKHLKHGFGFDDDDDFGFGKGFGGGFDSGFGGKGTSTSVKRTTQIINGKKITKTETTTIDSQGNKKTVIKEEIGDGQVREYLLGNDGGNSYKNRKQIGTGGHGYNKRGYDNMEEMNHKEERKNKGYVYNKHGNDNVKEVHFANDRNNYKNKGYGGYNRQVNSNIGNSNNDNKFEKKYYVKKKYTFK